MAKMVTVTLTDDIDPNLEADETVSFALDGISYEVDLATVNAQKLREALSPYTNVGRKLARGGRLQARGRAQTAAANGLDLNAIRAWAAANGIQVAARGRVAQSVVDQYNNR